MYSALTFSMLIVETRLKKKIYYLIQNKKIKTKKIKLKIHTLKWYNFCSGNLISGLSKNYL